MILLSQKRQASLFPQNKQSDTSSLDYNDTKDSNTTIKASPATNSNTNANGIVNGNTIEGILPRIKMGILWCLVTLGLGLRRHLVWTDGGYAFYRGPMIVIESLVHAEFSQL